MNRFEQKHYLHLATGSIKVIILLITGTVIFTGSTTGLFAQSKFSKTYPATKNVRLQLTNRTGTITVQGWDRNEVRISAALERPTPKIQPQNLSGTIIINVVRDNQGRGDIGDANFTVFVPYSTSVDIETRIGNLNVSNVRGGLVRAHITSEGDVTLTNIGALSVSAKNLIGNIFYDGLIKAEGIYRFVSTRGDINLRIPLNSSFRLIATAPSTRNISLGAFFTPDMRYVGTGRRITGKMGSGSASLTVTNQRGSISFLRR